MAINDALLNIGATAQMAAATHAAIHTAQPDASGSNESTADRLAIVWDPAADGDMLFTTPLNFTGGASGGPATHVGLWSAVTGGDYYGDLPLTGDQAFNAAGEYTVLDGTIDGSSS